MQCWVHCTQKTEECKDENKIKYAKDITWKCKCDCGNIHYTLTSLLKAGNVQSCGCIKSKGEEKISKIKNMFYYYYYSVLCCLLDVVKQLKKML